MRTSLTTMNDQQINRAAILIGLFGGVSRMAELTDLDKATISRWASDGKRGGHGRVPAHFNTAIMDAGRKAGIHADKIRECLDLWRCPCCLQELNAPINAARLPNEMRKFVAGGG
jgi:hypothetical protein